MQHPVEADFDTRQPGRDVAPDEKRKATADDPPDAGSDTEAAGGRRTTRIRVHCSQADAGAQQAEQKLDGDDEDDAAENGGPGDTPMRVSSHRSRKWWCPLLSIRAWPSGVFEGRRWSWSRLPPLSVGCRRHPGLH